VVVLASGEWPGAAASCRIVVIGAVDDSASKETRSGQRKLFVPDPDRVQSQSKVAHLAPGIRYAGGLDPALDLGVAGNDGTALDGNGLFDESQESLGAIGHSAGKGILQADAQQRSRRQDRGGRKIEGNALRCVALVGNFRMGSGVAGSTRIGIAVEWKIARIALAVCIANSHPPGARRS